MHFSQAVTAIQNQVGTIRGVEVLYNGAVSDCDGSVNEVYQLLRN